jgi:hypothetical protein
MPELEESWMSIPRCPDYEASSLGRIRCAVAVRRRQKHRIIPQHAWPDYLVVALWYEGKMRSCKVHQLVCEAFHGRSTAERPWVNHIDCDIENNRPDNLEWCSASENRQHAVRLFRDNVHRKLTFDQVLEIRGQRGLTSQPKLAAKFGVSKGLIWAIQKNAIWSRFY